MSNPSGISFTLPGNEIPSMEILSDGSFKVNGRKVGKDADLFHAAVKFFGAVEDWKTVEDCGHPEQDLPVWFYCEHLGVSYGRFADPIYISTMGNVMSAEKVTHWIEAPDVPVRYMDE